MTDSSLPIFASRRARSGQLDIFPWNGWKFRKNIFKTAMEDTGYVAGKGPTLKFKIQNHNYFS